MRLKVILASCMLVLASSTLPAQADENDDNLSTRQYYAKCIMSDYACATTVGDWAVFCSCPPEGTTYKDIVDNVASYLQRHQEMNDAPWLASTMKSLDELWPCPDKSGSCT